MVTLVVRLVVRSGVNSCTVCCRGAKQTMAKVLVEARCGGVVPPRNEKLLGSMAEMKSRDLSCLWRGNATWQRGSIRRIEPCRTRHLPVSFRERSGAVGELPRSGHPA